MSPQRAGTRLLKLWRAAMGSQLPVDVAQLALEWSRQIAPDGPIGEVKAEEIGGFEGGLFWLPTRRIWALLYHPREATPGRARFTIGHELGHFALHRTLTASFRCSQNATLGEGSGGQRIIEREADLFASYLLMPMDDFRTQVARQHVTLDVLADSAQRYGVSLTAAALKWLEFTHQAAAIVVSREGMVEWWRCSTSARPAAFASLRRGAEIPAEALAAMPALVANPRDLRTGIDLPQGIWFPNCGVREMLVVSDRYDMAVSLLVLDTAGIAYDEEETRDLTTLVPRLAIKRAHSGRKVHGDGLVCVRNDRSPGMCSF